MKKVLIIILVVLLLVLLGMGGFIWYRGAHIFVEDAVYPKSAKGLDLRGTGISAEHYETVQAQLPDCEIVWDVPFQGKACSSDAAELKITSLAQKDLAMVKYFTNLKRIDATDCREYDLLNALQEQLPRCEIIYGVDLGGAAVAPGETEAKLEKGTYSFEAMMENLPYLPKLTKLTLPMTNLSYDEITQLGEAYENLQIDYTVEFMGKEQDPSVKELNLSSLSSGDVEQAAEGLRLFRELETVELMAADGSSQLSMEDVKKLQTAAPDAVFHYTFTLFDQTISTTDETVKFTNKRIGDAGEPELRLALDIMETCKKFILDNCKFSDEVMAKIRDDYRDKLKVVWRIWFGDGGSSLTDAQVLRAVYGLADDNSKSLVYCENVRFIDIGHSEFLDYADFLSGMTELEVAILSGAPLKSLDPIANCKNLKFLEIANCIYLPDINAVKECTELEMLNISYTRFEDLSPLDDLNLTHLTGVVNNVSEEEEQRFVELHPDCWTVFTGPQPYGEGWRYDAEGNKLPWYAKLSDAFGYPNPYNNVGWYLKTE